MYSNFPENDYRNYLMHYSEGQRAKSHKYLYIDSNGNYVYPEDVRKVGIGAAAKGIANRAKTGITSAVQKGRTALASRSAKNKDRSAYRSTGKNKLQRAQSDINDIWQKNYGPSSGSNYKRSLRDRVGATSAHIKNRASNLVNRAMTTLKSTRLGRAVNLKRSRKDINNQWQMNIGSGDYKASDSKKVRVQRAVRNISSAIKNLGSTKNRQKMKTALASLRPKNIRRRFKRATGK